MRWLCYEFISAIHLLYPHLTINVSPLFKKISCGWTCPPGTPLKVVEMIQQHLHDGLDEVLACSISAAQMSDSIAFSIGSEMQLPNSWKAAIRRNLTDRPANGILYPSKFDRSYLYKDLRMIVGSGGISSMGARKNYRKWTMKFPQTNKEQWKPKLVVVWDERCWLSDCINRLRKVEG